MDEACIEVYPRVHMGLISMHASGPRKNGGLGFATHGPPALVRVRPAPSFILEDHRNRAFSQTEVRSIQAACEGLCSTLGLQSTVRVEVAGKMLTHVGMGSGTAVRLAILEAICLLAGIDLSPRQLIGHSGRGGTSGVGVQTYFNGGFVLDTGVPNDDAGFAPSSRAEPRQVPTSIPSLLMPDWLCCLCVPRDIAPKSQNEETEFFKATAPLPPSTSYLAAYHALFGAYSAIAEQDYPAFCAAVLAMQDTAWKQAEWNQYGDSLQEMRTALRGFGVDCIGLSSLGPLLYCFGSKDALRAIAISETELRCTVYVTAPRNAGRTIVRDSTCGS